MHQSEYYQRCPVAIDGQIEDGQAWVNVKQSTLPSGAATETTSAATKAILEDVRNAATHALKVEGAITTTPSGTQNANITQVGGTNQTARDWSNDLLKLQNIPSNPATDRATAAAPFASRLTDGAAFYKATTPSDTQPISAVSLPLPSGAATDAVITARLGVLGQATMANSTPVTIASNQSAIPVSQGSPGGASTPWNVKIGDGTNTVGVTAGGKLQVDAVITGAAGGTSLVDNSAFTAGTTTVTPIGGVFNDAVTDAISGDGAAARITGKRGVHVNLRTNSGAEIGTQASPVRTDPTGTTTQPVTSVSGSVTLAGQGAPGASAWLVDGSAVTQPVSGTVVANQGTSPWIISGALSSSNDIVKLGGNPVDVAAGAASSGTLRVINATDDANFSTLKVVGAGAAATALRVVMANDVYPLAPFGSATNAEIDLVNNNFATLSKAIPHRLDQELRFDDIAAGDLYIGRANDGTLTSDGFWEIVKYYRSTTGAITRQRYRTGVVWNNRTSGWT